MAAPVSKRNFSLPLRRPQTALLLLRLAWMLAIAWNPNPQAASSPSLKSRQVVEKYCVTCHDPDSKKGSLDLAAILQNPVAKHSAEWERVIRRVNSRQMPPVGRERPDDPTLDAFTSELSDTLDRLAAGNPRPGRTDTFRRLNRTEYRNAIRDLLALDVDPSAWLPKDDAGHGFDNVTVGDLSPTLLDRYITAAQRISRLAIGSPDRGGFAAVYRVRPDLTQEEHVEGLPFGTRGGTLIQHSFPRSGEYEIQVRLTRDRNEEIEGLRASHELVVLLDGKQVADFVVAPPVGHRNFETVDEHLKVRIPVEAGPRRAGVTFIKKPGSLLETKRQPYNAHFNMHRHPRLGPAVFQVTINGPSGTGDPGSTPSRNRIFTCRPSTAEADTETACAEKIISTLQRRAWRRPVTPGEIQRPMEFFRKGRDAGGFEAGIEEALSSILVSPEFLFRIERDPSGLASGASYRVSDLALASRLSFFLWGSIPDDELLDLAARGKLGQPRQLEKQTRRLLADPRARHLVDAFAGQWLHLRNLESFTPDLRLFPDFDDNLRQAFRRETELHFEAMMRQDRSVLSLLRTDHTYLNERLARHYGLPNILGSHFRKVPLENGSARGGLLRQGSVLTVTSYATRTSPVIRGQWVLGNLLGNPPPPPPANVPALDDNTVSSSLPMREKLAAHRANAACAGCHNLMDPVGLALEKYDAIGRYRLTEDGSPIDTSGALPDGSRFDGVDGLERAMLERPGLFVTALTEKLMTFALGRGLETSDAPAIRKIVRESQTREHCFSSLVVGIVRSVPFNQRQLP